MSGGSGDSHRFGPFELESDPVSCHVNDVRRAWDLLLEHATAKP